MRIHDIIGKIYADEYTPQCQPVPKKYPEGYIFDEAQTLRWNRKKVREENGKSDAVLSENIRQENVSVEKFLEDLRAAISEEYCLNETQTKMVVTRAWAKGCADGYISTVVKAADIVEFAKALLIAAT